MKGYFGIDTSNYTTSTAVYLPENNRIINNKKLLPVAEKSLGLRQSDAVFHHNRLLPDLIKKSVTEADCEIEAVGVSVSPRNCDGSYMPCFTVGAGYAEAVSSVLGVRKYEFSHQTGHIAASLLSSGRTELIDKPFIAFHFSGGTTDALYVCPDKCRIFNTELVYTSLDLKAGQAVDRVGNMLGLDFPAGSELEKLAIESKSEFKIKPFFRDGNPSLSGIENKCADMIKKGVDKNDVAKYCIDYITEIAVIMTENMLGKFGDLPVIYAGGVMSDIIIKNRLTKLFDCSFAEPCFSSDNAAGIAYCAYIRENL